MREREREWGRNREREGDTESEAGSRLRAVSTESNVGLELTDRGLELTDRGLELNGPRDRDLAEVGRLTDCATQAPLGLYFYLLLSFF